MARVCIIGAGNVAWHVARRLQRQGVDIAGIWSRDIANSRALALGFDLDETIATDNLAALDPEADLYLIAVPDKAVEAVAKALPKVTGLVAHTSACVPLEAIPETMRRAKIYPFQTFTKGVDIPWERVNVFVMADNEDVSAEARQWADILSPRVHSTDAASLQRLHVAAAFACNFVCHLLYHAQEIWDSDDGAAIFGPLIQATFDKALRIGPRDAQTGPARRGDNAIIDDHKAFLTNNYPRGLEIYDLLTRSILDTYEQNRLRPTTH